MGPPMGIQSRNHAGFFRFHAFMQKKGPITQSRRPIGGPLRCSYKIDIFEEKWIIQSARVPELMVFCPY